MTIDDYYVNYFGKTFRHKLHSTNSNGIYNSVYYCGRANNTESKMKVFWHTDKPQTQITHESTYPLLQLQKYITNGEWVSFKNQVLPLTTSQIQGLKFLKQKLNFDNIITLHFHNFTKVSKKILDKVLKVKYMSIRDTPHLNLLRWYYDYISNFKDLNPRSIDRYIINKMEKDGYELHTITDKKYTVKYNKMWINTRLHSYSENLFKKNHAKVRIT